MFSVAVGDFRIQSGIANIGLGKSQDGVVFAIVIPDEPAAVTSDSPTKSERAAHIWLRFHPREVEKVFPPETVSRAGASSSLAFMKAIAAAKMRSSFQANGLAMIPPPEQLIADADTTNGIRRFFILDREANSSEYVDAFEQQAMPAPAAFDSKLAESAFDQLWTAFDHNYAMFILRPEVDWQKLREQFRPKATASKSTSEFASICAEMLSKLRDLHVSLSVGGQYVPCFNRARVANADPEVIEGIVRHIQRRGMICYGSMSGGIGYIQLFTLTGKSLENDFDATLDEFKGSGALVLDVRLNGGGSEEKGRHIASRFLTREYTYAYSRYRNGPGHTNLTDFLPRRATPSETWHYEKPVMLLIGQKCMSSAESFVAMMSGATNVTIMGDHTCGSSGNPKVVNLPLSLSVSVPQWIDYLPDRTPIHEKGFSPQVVIGAESGDFRSGKDPVLQAALERARHVGIRR